MSIYFQDYHNENRYVVVVPTKAYDMNDKFE